MVAAQKNSPNLPKPHQKSAIKDSLSGFKTASRGQVIMACGTGKTLVGMHVAHGLQSRTTIVLVPSLLLVEQMAKDWLRDCPFKFELMLLCGDADAGRGSETRASREALLDLRQKLSVSTDSADFRRFLNGKGRRVVIGTYHSAPVLRKLSIDLIIFDEAHRTAGDGRKHFGFALSDKNIRAKKRLFMTATPRIVKDSSTNKDAPGYSFSMDDEKIYGGRFHTLTFAEAVQKKLLVDYELVVVGVKKEEIAEIIAKNKKLARLFDRKTNLGVVDARTAAGVALMAHARRKYKFKRSLTFHRLVARASQFASLHGGEYVSGDMQKTERERHIKDFVERGGNIANCKFLAEGVDIKAIDAAAFIDPKTSAIDLVQAIGRAVRLSPGKETAFVLVAVPAEDDSVSGEELLIGDFTVLRKVLCALRGVDPEIDDVIRRMARNRAIKATGRQGGVVEPIRKIHIEGISTRDRLNSIAPEFFDAIEAKVVEIGGASTEQRVQESVEHWKTHGCWPTKNTSVGAFLHSARTGNIRLSASQQTALIACDANVFDNQRRAVAHRRLVRLQDWLHTHPDETPRADSEEGRTLKELRRGTSYFHKKFAALKAQILAQLGPALPAKMTRVLRNARRLLKEINTNNSWPRGSHALRQRINYARRAWPKRLPYTAKEILDLEKLANERGVKRWFAAKDLKAARAALEKK
jgi:superfamily II DNA or RNA helicase